MSHRIGNIYCFDTSSFVCLKYSFPLDSWLQPMWGLVDDRAADGRLVAPREVRREINEHYKNDELKDWIRAHENVIREMDDAQEHYMKMIMKKFPNIIDIEAERPNADAHVVALARSIQDIIPTEELHEECIVVAEEKGYGGTKIPAVCKHLGLRCINLVALGGLEGMRVSRSSED